MEFSEEGMLSQEKTVTTKPPFFRSKQGKLLLVLSVFIFVILIFILLIPKKSSIGNIPKPSIITPPQVVVTVTPEVGPSVWATDSGVLRLEEKIKNLASEVQNIDLNESSLSLPNIDTSVTFEK